LHYLQNALKKLPSCAPNTKVYRGISSRESVHQNYITGRRIHWSAYTSSTTDRTKAKNFATQRGVIFSIVLTNDGGKEIQDFSPFTSEREILISPNIELVVTNQLQLGEDGYYYVELVQVLPKQAHVF